MAKNALLISVRPRFAEMIFTGTKTVELRRIRPRIGRGDLVFIYVSSPVKALEGAFEVGEVVPGTPSSIWQRFREETGLSKREFDTYYEGKPTAFAIVIQKCWKLPAPIHLAILQKQKNGFHPPQSYHYICRQAFSRRAGFDVQLELQQN
jgi:predicted transcriptional regulator